MRPDRDDKPEETPAAVAQPLEAKARALMRRGDLRAAAAACRELNRRHPGYVLGWHIASHLALRMGNAPAALAAIAKALAIEPDSTAGLLQRGLCLARLGHIEELAATVERLRARRLHTAWEHSTLGMLLTRLERRQEAVACYERAALLEPGEAKHHYNVAALERSLGHSDAAERRYDEAIRLNPTDYEAWKIRSELRTQTPDANHVAELEGLLEAGIDDARGRVQVLYALAKELEDLGEPARSFACLKQGADTRRSYMRYDVSRDLETMAALEREYGPHLFGGPVAGDDNAEAIFVLGLPRTGTTLVERILSSHADVFAAGELTHFAEQMMRLVRAQGGAPPQDRNELVQRSTGLDFRALGRAYIESTRPFTGHTARFIDKLPLNFLYVGLIHLALPNARIVSVRRHPLDTCYAIYKQLFVDAYPFSYDLTELGRYYVAYDRLMKHWESVLPGVVHTVRYEDVVEDLDTEARRLVAYCGLDWQPRCLAFHSNPQASTTASTTQVRQPLYRSSVGRWKDYREELAPLIEVLEAAGVPLGE
ncbi:MAG: sulfotransferase [Xanthomonadales bacterium]|nr:sulfotransferase [Xanthomonadales bacterium]